MYKRCQITEMILNITKMMRNTVGLRSNLISVYKFIERNVQEMPNHRNDTQPHKNDVPRQTCRSGILLVPLVCERLICHITAAMSWQSFNQNQAEIVSHGSVLTEVQPKATKRYHQTIKSEQVDHTSKMYAILLTYAWFVVCQVHMYDRTQW